MLRPTIVRLKRLSSPEVPPEVIALFGASGTAGDGILKAALADPDIRKIHVITRRATARIEEGIASGKVQMTRHMDYLDYENIQDQISGVDTVYWAIGTSSVGVDEETYGRIHVDFPMQFVREWTAINHNPDLSFHFISSSDISEDSKAMWVREKIRAEKSLFSFADGSNLRVIAYRPDYIGSDDRKSTLRTEPDVLVFPACWRSSKGNRNRPSNAGSVGARISA